MTTPPADAWVDVPFTGQTFRFVYPASEKAAKVEAIANEVFVAQLYRGVQPGDVVLDGGAFLGMFTRYALACGAEQVSAVEPNPLIFPYLRRNVLHNRTDAAACGVVPWALGDVVSPAHHRLHLRVDRIDQASAHVVPEGAGFDRYAVGMTIDEMWDGDHLDFLKLDIEGSELAALRGAEWTIRQTRPALAIALYHTPEDRTAIPAFIAALDCGYGAPELRGHPYPVGVWSRAR